MYVSMYVFLAGGLELDNHWLKGYKFSSLCNGDKEGEKQSVMSCGYKPSTSAHISICSKSNVIFVPLVIKLEGTK